MTKVYSRHEDDFWRTGFSHNSHYKQPELDEEFAFRWAPILSQKEIAELFNISVQTFALKFGDAYKAGKVVGKAKRRRQLEDLIDQLSQTDEYNHTHPEAKTNELIKAIQLWMRRYDGLGAAAQLQAPEEEQTEVVDPTEIKVVRPGREDM